jgi:hypothetical protein
MRYYIWPGSSTNPKERLILAGQGRSAGKRHDGLGKMLTILQLRGRKLLHGTSSVPQLEHAVRNMRRKYTSVTLIKGVRKEVPSQVPSDQVCSCHECYG